MILITIYCSLFFLNFNTIKLKLNMSFLKLYVGITKIVLYFTLELCKRSFSIYYTLSGKNYNLKMFT